VIVLVFAGKEFGFVIFIIGRVVSTIFTVLVADQV